MTAPAIRVENLGKQYRIGQSDQPAGRFRYKSLRDSLVDTASRPWRVLTKHRRITEENSFWALKDINFEVQPGEVVGIIGCNGAGKSTLLKILSQITKPTTGQIELRGRVGSLLEVGTGFHPELTGRENIFLNGAILGMTRAEVRKKFDEIVAFSEIERFLDTPVKQYSSGMYTRLAFAVAAHLDPEILVVDEVLAVGDTAFQKKCLGKMKDFAGEGRTVLFVSHNMGAVGQLCGTCLVLQTGYVIAHKGVHDAVEHYLSQSPFFENIHRKFDPPREQDIRILSLEAKAEGEETGLLDVHHQLTFTIIYEVVTPLRGANLGLSVYREGAPLFHAFDIDDNPHLRERRRPGTYRAQFRIPPRRLVAGRYSVTISCGQPSVGVIQRHEDALQFELEELEGDVTHASYARKRGGQIAAPGSWIIDT